ncbi:MAG TPA: hypothetical protein PKA64_09145 [Myxococcota bacterium]|nr:hypothetical protein [Myxococcota bacterium]
MYKLLLAFFLSVAALSPAAQASPTLTTRSEAGVTFSAPEGWKALVTADERSIVLSRDAFTTLYVKWHPYKEGASLDKMLDKMVQVTNDSLPAGSATETSRGDILGGKGKVAVGSYKNIIGYQMALGWGVVSDPGRGMILTGVLLSSPDGFNEIGGKELITQVLASLQAPKP